MLKTISLLFVFLCFLFFIISKDKDNKEEFRSFDKGQTVWHD